MKDLAKFMVKALVAHSSESGHLIHAIPAV